MELLWTSAAQRGGCFIIDATRQGKRFPDSFSKTIPIWACVLNRTVCKYRKATLNCEEELSLNEGDHADFTQASPTKLGSETWDCSLHLPLWVSDTEREEIERRIDDWVDIFWAANADIASLSKALRKPLQPLWISQSTVVWLNEVPDAASWTFTPIILVSASQPIARAQRMTDGGSGWNYIPGAADDEESWARGLTPGLFWKHALSLLKGSAESCTKMVADIVERERVSRAYRGLEADQVRVKPLKKSWDEGIKQEVEERFCEAKESINNEKAEANESSNLIWIGETNLAVGNALCVQSLSVVEPVDCVINCGTESLSNSSFQPKSYLQLPVVDSKQDRFSLQNNLFQAVTFAKENLKQHCSLLIICADGEDLSVCVCLTILLALFNREGFFDDGSTFAESGASKWDVRQRLVYVCNYAVNARPSRGNLRQVFQYLSSCRSFNLEKPNTTFLQGHCQEEFIALQNHGSLSNEQELV